jgi:hypothetical protein
MKWIGKDMRTLRNPGMLSVLNDIPLLTDVSYISCVFFFPVFPLTHATSSLFNSHCPLFFSISLMIQLHSVILKTILASFT